jgi:two-component system response regulator PilR (NtrC family)
MTQHHTTLPTYRAYIVGRTIFATIALLSTFITLGFQHALMYRELMAVLCGALIASVCSALWYSERAHYKIIQCGIDALLITGIVYLTGGAISPFLFLYLLPVIVGAVFHTRLQALLVSVALLTAYGVLLLFLLYNVDGESSIQTPSSGILLQFIGLGSGMILVAIATSFLGVILKNNSALVEQSTRALTDLHREKRAVEESLSEGVLSVDKDGKITLCTQAARLLLGVSYEVESGTPLVTLLDNLEISLPHHFHDSRADGIFECSLNRKGQEFIILFEKRAVLDETGTVQGALYLLRDVTSLRTLEEQVRKQEQVARLLAEIPDHRNTLRSPAFVGESVVMKKVFNLIERVAPSDATVLITGESGTGKELVARAIHEKSTHAHGPFVPLNCSAIPENLLESELFGHKRGSFTGADEDHQGLFRQAEGGTLFLDEIGELPLHLQTKLLRALQNRAVRPVGGDRDIPVNVRILAATNRNLRKGVTEGSFREDLYYRLNVIGISLPPLRERREDLPHLIQAIVHKLTAGGQSPVIPAATLGLLNQYSYPGNVRELENILERAIVLGGRAILPEHLPDHLRNHEVSTHQETTIIVDDSITFPVQLDTVLASIERRYLEAALVQTKGGRKKAAELLGVNFRSLRYRLQKFGLNEEERS